MCLLAVLPMLSGCVGLAVKGAMTASDQATIAANEDAANHGDPAAQYKVGRAHCCSVGPVDPLHDSRKATLWLCRAARRDYAPAQYLLGRIYSGHPVAGLDPQQQAKLTLAGAPVNRPVAMLWLARAAASGDKDAADAGVKLQAQMSSQERATSEGYAKDWPSAPCDYDAVFPTGSRA
jgi:TPR repeat protein